MSKCSQSAEWESHLQGSRNYSHSQPEAVQPDIIQQIRLLIMADVKILIDSERRRDLASLKIE